MIESALKSLGPYLAEVRIYSLPPTNGEGRISEARHVFFSIDPAISHHCEDHCPSPPTSEARANLYDVIGDHRLQDIIDQLHIPLEEFALTQDQIIDVVRNEHATLELDTYAVFALLAIDHKVKGGKTERGYFLLQIRNDPPGKTKISIGDYIIQEVHCENSFKKRLLLQK